MHHCPSHSPWVTLTVQCPYYYFLGATVDANNNNGGQLIVVKPQSPQKSVVVLKYREYLLYPPFNHLQRWQTRATIKSS